MSMRKATQEYLAKSKGKAREEHLADGAMIGAASKRQRRALQRAFNALDERFKAVGGIARGWAASLAEMHQLVFAYVDETVSPQEAVGWIDSHADLVKRMADIKRENPELPLVDVCARAVEQQLKERWPEYFVNHEGRGTALKPAHEATTQNSGLKHPRVPTLPPPGDELWNDITDIVDAKIKARVGGDVAFMLAVVPTTPDDDETGRYIDFDSFRGLANVGGDDANKLMRVLCQHALDGLKAQEIN